MQKQEKNPISIVEFHLDKMGYELTPYGGGVALAQMYSGYNEVEAAAYIALISLAYDIREAGYDFEKNVNLTIHGYALINVIKAYYDSQSLHPTEYQKITSAILKISIPSPEQEIWIDEVLSDPISGNQQIAIRRLK